MPASLGLFITLAVATPTFAVQNGPSEPLEPVIAEASQDAEQGMAGIRIPDGLEISLFAAEPDVANVVAFDIDHQGRVYVCETFRQSRGVTDNRNHDQTWLLADLAAKTVQDRIDYHKRLLGDAVVTYRQHDDRIRRLVDTDGDGRADEITVVADGFNRLEEGTGAGILVRGNSIYYTCIPRLWKLTDSNGDGRADERKVLSEGYGVRVAFRGHDLHGPLLGPDGRLYFSVGDRGFHVTADDGNVLADPNVGAVFRCEPDGTGLEVYCKGLRNPQELAFNDVGDLFTVDNNSDSGDQARIAHLLEGADFGWRMHYQYLPDRGPYNRERIWEPFHADQPADVMPPVANLTDGPSGLTYYPGTGFGDRFRDTFLICDFRGGPSNSGVRSFRLGVNGGTYALKQHDQPLWSVLATDIAFGSDGAIYLSDWVNGWEGLGKGRIYRLTDPDRQTDPIIAEVQQRLASDWSATASDDLIRLLAHVDRRVRLEAQWELAERAEVDVMLSLAQDASSERTPRLHAIWGVDQVARRDASVRATIHAPIRELCSDPEPVIRSAAVKVAGERRDDEATPLLRERLADDSPRVRYFAAMSLAHLKAPDAFDDVVAMLDENDNQDPALRHAGTFYLAKAVKPSWVADLSAHHSEPVRRAAVVALGRTSSELIARFLDDPSPRVVADAARAIYDRSIPVAMGPLAALAIKPPNRSNDVDPELLDRQMRRSLHANFRLGNAAAARVLANYASEIEAPESLRLQSLDLLGAWGSDDPRDRFTGEFDPGGGRNVADARDALTPLVEQLMASHESIRERVMQVASTLGIKKIVPALIRRVGDKQKRVALRATALRSLARLDPLRAVKVARNVEPEPANELVRTALTVLKDHDANRSVPVFIRATRSSGAAVRQAAWDALARASGPLATETIEAAVRDYLDGSLAADSHLNVLEAAEGRIDEPLAKELAAHRDSVASEDPLGQWLPSLQGGDPSIGRRLFFEKAELSCVRCHRVAGDGGAVGPDLTNIAKTRDRRYLLESICLPDATIAEGYETAVVATDDGQVFAGIVQADIDDQVELLMPDGAIVRIPDDEIVARKKGPSSMPADLIRHLSARELRDLVAYLATLDGN